MKHIKIRSFTLDRGLGYLIQNLTKDNTQEILTYFYGIAQFVVDDLARTSKAQWINKDIVLFYKETPISYRIRIGGPGPGRRLSDPDYMPRVDIDVTYPKETDQFNVTDLMNAAVEAGLGLVEEQNTMPRFTRPELKTPKCLRKVRIAQSEERDKTPGS